jgi:hypothetical protein
MPQVWVAGHGATEDSGERTTVPPGWRVLFYGDEGQELLTAASLAALAGGGPRDSYDDSRPIPNYQLSTFTLRVPGRGEVPDDARVQRHLESITAGAGQLYFVGLEISGVAKELPLPGIGDLGLCGNPRGCAELPPELRHRECEGLFARLYDEGAGPYTVHMLSCRGEAGDDASPKTVAIGAEEPRASDAGLARPDVLTADLAGEPDDDRIIPSAVRYREDLIARSYQDPVAMAQEYEAMPKGGRAFMASLGLDTGPIWQHALVADWPAEDTAPAWFPTAVYGRQGEPPGTLEEAWSDPRWRNAFWFWMQGVGEALGLVRPRERALLELYARLRTRAAGPVTLTGEQGAVYTTQPVSVDEIVWVAGGRGMGVALADTVVGSAALVDVGALREVEEADAWLSRVWALQYAEAALSSALAAYHEALRGYEAAADTTEDAALDAVNDVLAVLDAAVDAVNRARANLDMDRLDPGQAREAFEPVGDTLIGLAGQLVTGALAAVEAELQPELAECYAGFRDSLLTWWKG